MIDILLIETIYMLLLVIPSMIIYLKARNVYKFSNHKGIKYFSDAFKFLAIGFLIRYIIMIMKLIQNDFSTIKNFDIFTLMMEISLMMTGFLLLYSMTWKRFNHLNIFKKINFPIISIYVLAFIFAFIDLIIKAFYMMYISQIFVFSIASIISYKNFNKKKTSIKQLYFISMILFFIVWTINLIAQYTIDIIPTIRLYAYLFTFSGSFIILYVTLKLTSDNR